MRVFLTGGTGFVGGVVARLLRARGDEVVALVRDVSRAGALTALGCTTVKGDLDTVTTEAMTDCDGVIHSAAVYTIGIPRSEVESMRRANVDGTARVIDAAVAAGVGKLVYVSTLNVFGDTKGAIADESYVRDLTRGFVSAYDETKVRAHEVAAARAADGAPVVIVMPGVVYGPGDTSQIGEQAARAMRGKLPYVSFPTLGITACYVDDVAAGVVAALDRGAVGEEYCLGGEITTMRGLIDAAAAAGGRRPPRFTMPTWLIKATAPIAPLLGPMLGLPKNLRETIAASDGVTYWGSDERARRELGTSSRSLAEGMAATAAAEASF